MKSIGFNIGINTPRAGGGVDPFALLQGKGAAFLYHDFLGRTDLTFQDASLTAADDPTEAVAIALSKDEIGDDLLATVIAAQTELVTNGAFSADSNWIKGVGWSIGSGVASCNGLQVVATNLYQDIGMAAGKMFLTALTVSGLSAGAAYVGIGGSNLQSAMSANGAYQFMNVRGTNSTLYIQGNASFVGSVDDVSAKEVPGYNASQFDSTSYRPTRQSDDAVKGDGLDDNFLSRLTSATSMFMAVAMLGGSNPASFGALIGGPIGTARGYLGRNSSGQLCAGVGTDSIGTIVGGGNLSGVKGVAMLNIDASGKVDLEWMPKGGSLTSLYSAAINGSVDAGTAMRLWATNASGSAANFGADSVYLATAIQSTLTAAERLALAKNWNARIPS